MLTNLLTYTRELFDSLLQRASDMLNAVAENVLQHGPWYANWAMLLLDTVYPFYEVAICGDEYENELTKANSYYLPNTVFLGGKNGKLPLLEGKYLPGKTLVYVCEGKTCSLPADSFEEIKF